MKDFNIAKYLRENHLGSHAILGNYVDLHALKEAEDLEGLEVVKGFGATKSKSVADQFAKTAMTAGMEGVKVVEKDGVFKIYAKAGGKLKEKKMNSGKNSETITLSYYDYPSIDDDDQIFAVETFIKFVKSLGGNAKVIKDAFDDIEFKLTGISSEEVKKAYAKMVKAEDKKSISNPGPFNYLTSWTVNPPGLDEYNQLGDEEEMELDTEIPYEGPEHKLDGFGDEFVQDKPVEELEKPEKIYSNDWMNDSVDGKRVGSWTCYYTDQMGTIYWVHDDIPGEHIMVYATPHWDGAEGIAIEVQVDYGEHTLDQEVVGDPSYPDFESYAQDMIPVLNKIESKYKSGKYHDYIDYGDSMDTDDSENPFPSIMKEKEDNSMTEDNGDYEDEDDRFASSGVQMEGEEFKWTARDQQGKLHGILYVKPMGDILMVTADDGMPGTKYTKADIADAMGRGEFIRFRGKDLALDTRMKAWAKPEVVSESSSMTLSNYYRNAEPRVLNTANALDRLLKTSLKDKNKAGEFVDLAIMLADAWAEQKMELSLGRNWQYDKK